MSRTSKQNIELPRLHKAMSLELLKDTQANKPKLNKILYQPMWSPGRFEQKVTILQALMTNRNYDDLKDEKKEKQIHMFLQDTQKQFFQKDERNRSLIGKDAPMKYYDNYKNLQKLINRKKLNGFTQILPAIEQDPSTRMLQQVEKQGVLPCTMGLVKSKGEFSVMNVKGQKFGDKYVKALSAGLKESKLIQFCQLSNNRLTDEGFNEIMKGVSHDMIKLDFSSNSITKINEKLLNTIKEPDARLQYLNLENNLLSDLAVNLLCRNACLSRNLRYLNIRKNLLTKQSGECISQLILRSGSLQQLYIGINRINQQGAISIFESLEENRNLKIFDYCMNKLGESNPSCAKMLGNVLAVNKNLLHVDFSDNNFNEQESSFISEKLHGNKTIYGFHFNGNYGYVDSKGFLKVEKKNITSLHSIVQKNISSYDIVFRREGVSLEPIKYKNVCWICQGWYEQIFRFVIPDPSEDGKNYVYLHFDFEQYQPRLINISDVKVRYKTMVPPRKYRYFFTWNGEQYLDIVNHGTMTNIVNNCDDLHEIKYEIPLTYTYQMNHEQVSFIVERASCRSGKPKKVVDAFDELILSVLPRQEGLATKKEKKAWSFKDSLWAKQWKLDDDQLTKMCFEKDWKCSKLPNFIKNPIEQEKVKQLLNQSYKLIKQIYRHYSSWSPFGDIWAISNNAFTDFCQQSKIISKDTPLKITDLTFITTNSISGADYKGNSLVPERGLVRFQFMQGMVRLAQEKFKKNGLSESILGSVTSMIKDHIQPLEINPVFNSQKWRLQKYFCEENDMLLKRFRTIFTQIYKKNSKLKVKPGNKPFMCLGQFKSIIQRIGLAGNLIPERDIFVSFNCSMMTQVDQLENQRFIRMTQIEFIEAIARCSYILPNHCKIENIFGPITPFHAKFEWIIHELKILCSEEVKNNFDGEISLFRQSEDDD